MKFLCLHLISLDTTTNITRIITKVNKVYTSLILLLPTFLQRCYHQHRHHHKTGQGIDEGYGLTESGATVTTISLSSDLRPGSVGRLLPYVELKVSWREFCTFCFEFRHTKIFLLKRKFDGDIWCSVQDGDFPTIVNIQWYKGYKGNKRQLQEKNTFYLWHRLT